MLQVGFSQSLDTRAFKRMFKGQKADALRVYGGYVRREAKQSLKPAPSFSRRGGTAGSEFERGGRRKTSRAGSPPLLKKMTSPLYNLMAFEVNKRADDVIIGPKIFRNRSTNIGYNGKKTAPRLLELGGTLTFKNRRKNKRVRVAPRPFMVPAQKRANMKFSQDMRSGKVLRLIANYKSRK